MLKCFHVLPGQLYAILIKAPVSISWPCNSGLFASHWVLRVLCFIHRPHISYIQGLLKSSWDMLIMKNLFLDFSIFCTKINFYFHFPANFKYSHMSCIYFISLWFTFSLSYHVYIAKVLNFGILQVIILFSNESHVDVITKKSLPDLIWRIIFITPSE